MEPFFANPWFMAAGGALVASPILIHLINRMRYKRIRWAAMEFLLKSQKRNRRRLIIEQLILLLLRILLVLLAAFLLARYLYSGAEDAGGAKHYVILDSSLSTTDHWKEEGKQVTAFEMAKLELLRVVEATAKPNSAQEMVIYTLDDLDKPVWQGRLSSSTSVEEVRQKLDLMKPTALHLSPADGIVKATAHLKIQPQHQKVLHYIGDFRENKWVTGPEGERTTKAIDEALTAGININLLDVADPARRTTKQIANNHDNLAITDLRAETRVVAEGVPVEFTVTLHNYGTANKKTHLRIFVNGQEDFNGSKDTGDIPPAGKREEKFSLVLAKKKNQDIQPNDPLPVREQKRRGEQEFVRISAEIGGEETGLQADNYRDMVVELRKKVPALLIDGNNGSEGTAPGGDVFCVEIALLAAKAYDVERRTVDELDKINLDLYPSIYLLNVRDIKSEKAILKLADYVKRGGSLAYFLGPKMDVAFYNKKLHQGKINETDKDNPITINPGLFPVMVEDNPVAALEEPEKLARIKDRHPKILFKLTAAKAEEKMKVGFSTSDPESVILSLAKQPAGYRDLFIERYYITTPESQWSTSPAEQVQDLIMLPNRKTTAAYGGQVQALMKRVKVESAALAVGKQEFKNHDQAITDYYDIQVTKALSGPLFDLYTALDRMLNDPVPKRFLDNPDDPNPKQMKILWAQPTMMVLERQIKELIETMKYGDRLVVARPYGKGRVVACMTTAGPSSKWNDWGAGSLDTWSYMMFMMDLQRYLTSAGGDLNRLVGDPLAFTLEQAKYTSSVEVSKYLLPEVGVEAKAGQNENRQPTKDAPLVMKESTTADGVKQYEFAATETKRPGLYLYTFQLEGGPQEERMYAFNVDAENESDLRRAAREKLERPDSGSKDKGKIALRERGDDLTPLAPPHPDASESPWLYLLILVILVVEQALAVHLSFHLRGDGTGTAAAPVAA